MAILSKSLVIAIAGTIEQGLFSMTVGYDKHPGAAGTQPAGRRRQSFGAPDRRLVSEKWSWSVVVTAKWSAMCRELRSQQKRMWRLSRPCCALSLLHQIAISMARFAGCGLGVRRGPFEACDPIYYAGYGSGYRTTQALSRAGSAMGAARTWRAIFTGFAGPPVTRSR